MRPTGKSRSSPDCHDVHRADRLDFSDPNADGMDFICWRTVAPSSIDIYPSAPTASRL